jgi:ABC-type transporter Mla subunit MlaD
VKHRELDQLGRQYVAHAGRAAQEATLVDHEQLGGEQELRNLVTSSARVFEATASQNDALAETFRIFPTFLDESKSTLARLQTFATDTRPLIRDLPPAMRDLRPALRDVRALSPDLEAFFRDLDPLIVAARKGLPATAETLRGLEPVLAEAGPFLEQVNPILRYLEINQSQISVPSMSIARTLNPPPGYTMTAGVAAAFSGAG